MSKPVGPYTPVVRAGNLAFCSGQLGLSDGALVEGFANQVRRALVNLDTVLKNDGLEFIDIVKVNVYLTDMSQYGVMNDIYVETFGSHRPARAAVGVTSLPLGALFEVDAVAHVR